ncbi:hypothetical protein [Methylosinus sp. PW1]|uniref:hypothetical protein n=1 Tax=Methylosinus sp. PW1 TaxID=107636 RepID=UPI0012EC2BAD|nr:hypothetical protein [Methylosinus sp. PW1]
MRKMQRNFFCDFHNTNCDDGRCTIHYCAASLAKNGKQASLKKPINPQYPDSFLEKELPKVAKAVAKQYCKYRGITLSKDKFTKLAASPFIIEEARKRITSIIAIFMK